MCFASRNVYDIAHLKSPRFLTFGADQAISKCYCKDLTSFVGMPEGPCAGRADIGKFNVSTNPLAAFIEVRTNKHCFPYNHRL